VPLRALTVASWALVAFAALAPAPALGQIPWDASPGWYVVPALGVAAEYDSNVFGTADNRRDDVLLRVSPGLTLGYVSQPFTILGRYIIGVEAYADNSDLNGLNRQAASLDVRYRPTRRWRLGLRGGFLESDSITELAAPGARLPEVAEEPRVEGAELEPPGPDRDLTPIPSAATLRRETTQIVVAPLATFELDRLTSLLGSYIFRLSDEENQATDTEHTVRLGVERRLTALDRASLNYIFRYFDEGDSTDGDETSSSHAVTVGYGRRLTPLTDVSGEIGPRVDDEGEVGVEARLAFLYRFRTGSAALTYSRSQGLVAGRRGAQTVDTLAAALEWTPLRNLTLGLVPGVGYYQREEDQDQGDGDTLVYGVTATARYRLTQWISIVAAYAFRYEDNEGGDAFPRHVLSIGLAMAYPYRFR
jgi:hypothetical protein